MDQDNTGNLYKSENIKYFKDIDVKDEKASFSNSRWWF